MAGLLSGLLPSVLGGLGNLIGQAGGPMGILKSIGGFAGRILKDVGDKEKVKSGGDFGRAVARSAASLLGAEEDKKPLQKSSLIDDYNKRIGLMHFRKSRSLPDRPFRVALGEDRDEMSEDEIEEEPQKVVLKEPKRRFVIKVKRK